MESKKCEKNAYNKIAVDSQRTNQRLPVGRVKGGGKDSSLFFLIQYFYVENKKNKDLLYNAGKYRHYFVITFSGA